MAATQGKMYPHKYLMQYTDGGPHTIHRRYSWCYFADVTAKLSTGSNVIQSLQITSYIHDWRDSKLHISTALITSVQQSPTWKPNNSTASHEIPATLLWSQVFWAKRHVTGHFSTFQSDKMPLLRSQENASWPLKMKALRVFETSGTIHQTTHIITQKNWIKEHTTLRILKFAFITMFTKACHGCSQPDESSP